jgi:hypothetical protein
LNTREQDSEFVSNGVTYIGGPEEMTKPLANWNIGFVKWGITENEGGKKKV